MAAQQLPEFGIDARWLVDGPPSGRNYVRHVVSALAARPDRQRYLAFVRSSADTGAAGQIRRTIVPSLPAVLFNTIGIPARAPGSLRSVVFQHFTPPRFRAGRVAVVHDLIYLSSPAQFSAIERAYLGLIPRLLPFAEVIATVSAHVRDQVLERWPKRDAATVIVAPNAVDDWILSRAGLLTATDATRDAPGDAAAVSDSGAVPHSGPDAPIAPVADRIGLRRPYVLYLGRLNARKNLPTLIRAFAASRLVDHDLVLAGAPSGVVEDLGEVAREAAVSDRVHLVGAVADEDLPALLGGAAAFAYVSLDEGFGVPPLEAMAFGVPVVCSDIPALRETAGPGGARLVSPDDVDEMAAALRAAVLDDAVRTAAAESGPPNALRYRWAATAQRLVDAMELAAR